MISETSSSSAGPNPSVVSAGVPILMPEVYHAPFGSRGTELRFVTTPASRSAGLCLPAREPEARGDVHENEVVVRPTAYEARSPAQKPFCERPGVGDYRRRVRGERCAPRFCEGDRLRSHHVRKRPPEHHRATLVNVRGVLIRAEHEPTARTTKRLVRRRGHDIGMRHRVEITRQDISCHEAQRSEPCRP